MSDPLTDNKSKDEIAAMVGMEGQPGTRRHTQLEAILMARCTGDLERACDRLRQSQEEAARSAHALSERLFTLNRILTVATVIGAVAAVVQVVRLFLRP